MADILLIEPNRQLAKQYQTFLVAKGHEVRWCTSAQAAISQADAGTPDLVVIELTLPSHSGVEFLYEFKSYTEWQMVPVIILSRVQQVDMPLSAVVLQKLGVRDYLYKPETSLAKLALSISRALQPTRIL